MAELKTKKTEASVERFLKSVTDQGKRDDSARLIDLMKQVAKAEPKMWGPSIIGFGDYLCVYPSGRELDWFVIGFSPRKQGLTIYMMGGLEQGKALLKDLGKHTTSKGCLYVKKLEDINLPTLKKLLQMAVKSKPGSGASK